MEAIKVEDLTNLSIGTPILCNREVECLGEFNPNCTSENYKNCRHYIEQEENYILREND